ncbi:MAG: M1 family metallopeptidase [Sphingomonas sp.]|nr:M1 family metallopeptidase [Sphingomonas sp.]
MNAPREPVRDSNPSLYGDHYRRINRLALISVATLLLIGAAPPEKGLPAISEQTQRSGGPVDPRQAALRFDSADLAMEIFPDKQAIAATAILDFTTTAPITVLLIDLDRNLPVTAVSINDTVLSAGRWSNPDGRLAITLPKPARAGDHLTARLTYGGTPHVAVRAPWDDGMVWARTPDGRPWIASTSEGYGCDLLWPCLDFPTGEPGQVTLHITVPIGLKAPSNGVLVGVDQLADGRTTWNWRIKHPNTYAIALNIGPYEVIEGQYKSRFGNTIPMFYWYLTGEEVKAKALFAEFAPTLDFFESTIGPYPFGDEKVGVVETPHLGMEHQTINAYGNGYKKAPEGFDWLFQHEFAHEWFGNQLTAANWDDYWLHEGFGEYMQPLYGRWREGDARYATMLDDQRNKIVNRAPLISGKQRSEEDVYEESKGGPATDIYYKGAWMLHTLRGLIGDTAFFNIVRREVYGRPDPVPGNFAPRYGSSTEFETLVNQETGKDFRWFFDVYLRQSALPELLSMRDAQALHLQWKTSLSTPFPMPVTIAVDGEKRLIGMPDGRATVMVPEGAHVVLDPDAAVLKRSMAVENYQAWQKSKPNTN